MGEHEVISCKKYIFNRITTLGVKIVSTDDVQLVTNSMKDLIAAAMMLGMKVSERSYKDTLFDDTNEPIIDSITSLTEQVKKFLSHCKIDDIDENNIIPLYQEIMRQKQLKRG